MKSLILTVVLFILIGTTTSLINPVTVNSHTAVITEPLVKKKNKASYQTVKNETEKMLGRKMKLREKIGLWISSSKGNDLYKNPGNEKAENQALWGFVFGVASIALLAVFPLFGILFIPGFILSTLALRKEKNNPGTLDRTSKLLARLGQIFSILSFVILVLVVLYFILYIGVITGGVTI
jgi:hypothetical protein